MLNYNIKTKLIIHLRIKYMFSSSSIKGKALLRHLQNSFINPCLIIFIKDLLATLINLSKDLIKLNNL